jgi:hypothetical protein
MQAARDNLKVIASLQERLYRIAAPLLINNADLCKAQARNLLGFTAKNKYSYPGEYADASAAVLGYDDVLQVSGVLAGLGGAAAERPRRRKQGSCHLWPADRQQRYPEHDHCPQRQQPDAECTGHPRLRLPRRPGQLGQCERLQRRQPRHADARHDQLRTER